MQLTKDQAHARNEILAWVRNPDATPHDPSFFVLGGAAGTGKQQPVDCSVQTPDGPRPIGDLAVGDLVLGRDGFPTRVTGVFPQGVQQAYRITFRDGSSTECGIEHNWTVKVSARPVRDQPAGVKVLTTAEIIAAGVRKPDGDYRFQIPLCLPAQYPERKLVVHPYLLGALIGDGTALGKTPTLVTPDIEIVNRCREVVPEGIVVREMVAGTCPRYSFSWPTEYHENRLADTFRRMNLDVKSPARFIPQGFLHATVPQRLDLLRGLMDTDGCCKNNRTSFSTRSPRLAADVVLLVQSLGGTAIARSYDRGDKGVDWAVNVKLNVSPFYLSRKALLWSPSSKNPPSRYITKIEPSRTVEQVCIQVAAADNLYLTDEYIVTHNTTMLRQIDGELRGIINEDDDDRTSPTLKWAATTGKAARRLSEVVGDARTLHATLYVPPGGESQTLSFEQLQPPPAPGSLVVVDEASMITPKLYADMEQWAQFGVRFLCVGDPYQLPPVITKAEAKLYNQDFTIFTEHTGAQLNEVVRGSGGIIEVVTRMRETQDVPTTSTDCYQYHHRVPLQRGIDSWFDDPEDHVLITWTNKLRMRMNALIRARLGHSHLLVRDGEPVLFCRNGQGMMNGEIATGTFTEGEDFGEIQTVWLQLESGRRVQVNCQGSQSPMDGQMPWVKDWGAYRAALSKHHRAVYGRAANRIPIAEPIPITYGYALTAHKSQGSEFRRVTVLLRNRADYRSGPFLQPTPVPGGTLNFGVRWTYTALTRATERIDLYIA